MHDVPTRDERMEENQKLFRRANEKLDERVAGLELDSRRIPFLCECADLECLGRVDLFPSEYGEVRARSNRYAVLPGHTLSEDERVTADRGHFHIAEKGS
jgi:hypothetical protein